MRPGCTNELKFRSRFKSVTSEFTAKLHGTNVIQARWLEIRFEASIVLDQFNELGSNLNSTSHLVRNTWTEWSYNQTERPIYAKYFKHNFTLKLKGYKLSYAKLPCFFSISSLFDETSSQHINTICIMAWFSYTAVCMATRWLRT